MEQVFKLEAPEQCKAIARGEISARELCEATLERIERSHELGAFTHVAHERALAQAKQVDARRAKGEPLKAMAGLPLPIKDLNAVAGLPCEYGSLAHAGQVAATTDPVAAALESLGTVTVGKTNTCEFGLSAHSENLLHPHARNPLDPARTPGGSSGGAAAAVASGTVRLAHASDGGGSIRIPSAACGLIGFKPSRGLVNALGDPGTDPGLSTEGFISASLRETAWALDHLTLALHGKPAPAHPLASQPGDTSLLEATGIECPRLRIGVVTKPLLVDVEVDSAALGLTGAVADYLEAQGHHVTAAPPPFTAQQWEPFERVWRLAAAAPQVSDEQTLDPLTRWLRDRARDYGPGAWERAVADLGALGRDVNARWDSYDAVLTPVLAYTAPPLGYFTSLEPEANFTAQKQFTPWCTAANIGGRPAVSLPLGISFPPGTPGTPSTPGTKTLPLSVMIDAKPGRDALLFSLASELMEGFSR